MRFALHSTCRHSIGAAAVPPLFLLAVVHGIALGVRAGASARCTAGRSAPAAVIGVGAFVVSFRALRDLMIHRVQLGAAWLFPAIIDTAVGVSTMMLVALGDKPARRARTMTPSANAQTPTIQRSVQPPIQSAKTQFTRLTPARARPQTVRGERAQTSAPVQPDPAQTVQDSAHKGTQVDADLASELIASGATTQSVQTVSRCWPQAVTVRRSTLPRTHRGSTTGLRSGSSWLPASIASGSSRRSADGSLPAQADAFGQP